MITKNSIQSDIDTALQAAVSAKSGTDALTDNDQRDVLNAVLDRIQNHCETINTNTKIGIGKIHT